MIHFHVKFSWACSAGELLGVLSCHGGSACFNDGTIGRQHHRESPPCCIDITMWSQRLLTILVSAALLLARCSGADHDGGTTAGGVVAPSQSLSSTSLRRRSDATAPQRPEEHRRLVTFWNLLFIRKYFPPSCLRFVPSCASCLLALQYMFLSIGNYPNIHSLPLFFILHYPRKWDRTPVPPWESPTTIAWPRIPEVVVAEAVEAAAAAADRAVGVARVVVAAPAGDRVARDRRPAAEAAAAAVTARAATAAVIPPPRRRTRDPKPAGRPRRSRHSCW